MPHTHFTTLISAENLGERLDAAPQSVFIADCRFDLADPSAVSAPMPRAICPMRII